MTPKVCLTCVSSVVCSRVVQFLSPEVRREGLLPGMVAPAGAKAQCHLLKVMAKGSQWFDPEVKCCRHDGICRRGNRVQAQRDVSAGQWVIEEEEQSCSGTVQVKWSAL